MTLIIILAAVLASAVLRVQERRHLAELNAEYVRLGLRPLDPGPGVQTLECMLTILLGATLCFPSGVVLVEAFAEGDPQQWKPLWDIVATGMALGVALLVVGTRALVRLRRVAARKSSRIP